MNAQEVWNATYTQLQMQFDRANFDTWLRDTVFLHTEPGLFVIGVRNSYAREMLQHRLYRTIRRVLCDVCGDPAMDIRFDLHKSADDEFDTGDMPLFQLLGQQPALEQPADTPRQPLHEQVARPKRPTLPDSELNPRFTFDRFVFGGENPLLYPAAQAVVERPGTSYNPLLIYGGVGLGKTHLLHAFGHAYRAAERSVLYVSSEAFTNDLIDAIRHRTTAMFRERYRTTDVLLVDDIQFIAGKDNTQEEFFHTFNELHMANKQIVLASDRHPSLLDGVVDRLRSRFESGLQCAVKPPDLETRLAILRLWTQERGIALPPSVLDSLAARAKTNIRELESMFNQVVASVEFTNEPLTIDTAEYVLDSYHRPRHHLTVKEVVEVTAAYHGMSVAELTGKKRNGPINQARQIAMYLARELTSASLPQIGATFGGRKHSTVLHSCNKVADDMTRNQAVRHIVENIRKQIGADSSS